MSAPPPPGMDLEAARAYVAALSPEQLETLKNLYNVSMELKKKKAEERAAEERAKATQQEILDTLARMIPVKVDVVRSSNSPDSVTSSETDTDSTQTVKEVVLGKMKAGKADQSVKPYRPRGSRERVLVDGHLFLFDKLNFDTKKRFFRCDRGGSCPARVHTASDSTRVIQWVQTHNHPPPMATEVAYYGFDMTKIRQGHVMFSTTSTQNPKNSPRASSLVRTSLLTPEPEDESTFIPKLEALAVESSDEVESSATSSTFNPVGLRIPDNFHRTTEAELKTIELGLTRFLLRNTELRNELMNSKKFRPAFFPDAAATQLVVFVACLGVNEDIFQMIKVPERKEESIRDVLMTHFNIDSSPRPLMVNVATKINVALTQQMIDDWKSEVFLRVDVSKPNSLKLHPVAQLD